MGTENLKEYYVEYSPIQNCFHIDTMDRIIKATHKLLERKIINGYMIIAGPFVIEQAEDFINKNRTKYERY